MQKPKVLSFTIYQKPSGIWAATKRIDRIQYTVYLGKSPDNAEEKIRAYCGKRGIDPDNLSERSERATSSKLEERIEALEAENAELREELDTLKKKISQIETNSKVSPVSQKTNSAVSQVSSRTNSGVSKSAPDAKKVEPLKTVDVLGYTVRRNSRGHWHANKKKNNIYICKGDEPTREQAEAKILKWHEKHGQPLPASM